MLGGKVMDNFMDKLAQKWNAGELIKANSAAEAMELKRLREQMAEYEGILQEMRKLNLKNVELLESSRQLLEEGIKDTKETAVMLQQSGDQKQLADDIINRTEDFVHKENVKVYRNVQAVVVDGLKEQTEGIERQSRIFRESGKVWKIMVFLLLLLSIGSIGLQVAQIMGVL